MNEEGVPFDKNGAPLSGDDLVLVERIVNAVSSEIMPPADPLTEDEIHIIEQWAKDQGAKASPEVNILSEGPLS